MSRSHLAALVTLAVTLVVWGAAEAYWSAWTVGLHRPGELERR
jgi:hypothetical protein